MQLHRGYRRRREKKRERLHFVNHILRIECLVPWMAFCVDGPPYTFDAGKSKKGSTLSMSMPMSTLYAPLSSLFHA